MILTALACSGSTLGQHHPCCFKIGDHVLMDMGAGAAKLTLQDQVQIQDILLSHPHLDHVKDLGFFAENIFSRFTQTVRVHGSQDTLAKIKAHLFNGAIWPDFTILPHTQKPVMEFVPYESRKAFKVQDMSVEAVEVNHPGSCHGLMLTHQGATLVYSGDTGPTEELWTAMNERGSTIKALLLECSFPNRLQDLAEISGHLTPNMVREELKKIQMKDLKVFMYHLKAPYVDEIMQELESLQDERIRLLLPGMKVAF